MLIPIPLPVWKYTSILQNSVLSVFCLTASLLVLHPYLSHPMRKLLIGILDSEQHIFIYKIELSPFKSIAMNLTDTLLLNTKAVVIDVTGTSSEIGR